MACNNHLRPHAARSPSRPGHSIHLTNATSLCRRQPSALASIKSNATGICCYCGLLLLLLVVLKIPQIDYYVCNVLRAYRIGDIVPRVVHPQLDDFSGAVKGCFEENPAPVLRLVLLTRTLGSYAFLVCTDVAQRMEVNISNQFTAIARPASVAGMLLPPSKASQPTRFVWLDQERADGIPYLPDGVIVCERNSLNRIDEISPSE